MDKDGVTRALKQSYVNINEIDEDDDDGYELLLLGKAASHAKNNLIMIKGKMKTPYLRDWYEFFRAEQGEDACGDRGKQSVRFKSKF